MSAALGGALDGVDGAPPRLATCQAVLSLVSGLASRQPLLLALEDAQWVGPASLQVLLFVAHRLDADAVLLVLARRTGVASPLDGVPRSNPRVTARSSTAPCTISAAITAR